MMGTVVVAVVVAEGDETVESSGVGVMLPEFEIATDGSVGRTGVGPTMGTGMAAQLDVPVEEVETEPVVLLDEVNGLVVGVIVEV